MLFVPGAGDFRKTITNLTGRPAAAWGAALTSGAINTKGAWVQVLADTAVTDDCYGILININSGAASAAARNSLFDIGVDPSGGTAYSVLIPDLLSSGASPANIGSGGVWYYFPLYIQAGSRIAARFACQAASATARVGVYLFAQPARPDAVKAGSIVEAFGVVAGSSAGTIVTPGTTAEGALTLLGTTDRRYWWWQGGMGCNDTTQTALLYALDFVAGSSTSDFRTLIQDQWVTLTAAEQQNNSPLTVGCVANVGTGENIYGRVQCSGTSDSAISLVAYGVA